MDLNPQEYRDYVLSLGLEIEASKACPHLSWHAGTHQVDTGRYPAAVATLSTGQRVIIYPAGNDYLLSGLGTGIIVSGTVTGLVEKAGLGQLDKGRTCKKDTASVLEASIYHLDVEDTRKLDAYVCQNGWMISLSTYHDLPNMGTGFLTLMGAAKGRGASYLALLDTAPVIVGLPIGSMLYDGVDLVVESRGGVTPQHAAAILLQGWTDKAMHFQVDDQHMIFMVPLCKISAALSTYYNSIMANKWCKTLLQWNNKTIAIGKASSLIEKVKELKCSKKSG